MKGSLLSGIIHLTTSNQFLDFNSLSNSQGSPKDDVTTEVTEELNNYSVTHRVKSIIHSTPHMGNLSKRWSVPWRTNQV